MSRRCTLLVLVSALAAGVSAGASAQPDRRHSGLADMSPARPALQRDDGQNPGLLWVQEGAALWQAPAGAANKACADCHTAASMVGVAARYPAWDAVSGTPLNLAGRINRGCVVGVRAEPWAPDAPEWLALEAWLAVRAAGLPVETPAVRP
ncbi:MAG: hypothetical protein CFE45_16905 [Burkholderiales bacterium PBB5]|nr:MAG: hypothetical protein CFE45_16905 [Burkholderiales bacterium PBB5]